MKHSFTQSKLNQSLCAKCYMTEDKHGVTECESCNNVEKCELLNGMLLCSNCLTSEKQHIESDLLTKQGASTNSILYPSAPQLTEPTVLSIASQIAKDHSAVDRENASINELGTPAISRSTDFFNARTKSINERWNEIVLDDSVAKDNKHFTLAKEVRSHFLHMKNVLFQAVEVQLECASNQRADQIYLNQLASKLREEERVKLHLQNIDYVPPIPKSAPKGPKLSTDDKIAADMARIMNIPIETAKRLLNKKVAEVTGFTCSCKETPGFCKLHSKG